MNETNLTPRQKSILNLVNQSNGLSREEIRENLRNSYPVSKPTLIRDIFKLIGQKLINSKNKGKNTRYISYVSNPLLKQFDLNQYFLVDPDNRINTRKSFDFEIYKNLNNLFSLTEIEKIYKIQRSFTKSTQKLHSDILKRELERFVIELSWKSSKIEGNTYTLLETESLIKEGKEAKGKNRQESIMILNHKKAFDQILQNRSVFKKISSSEINQLHQTMTLDLNITPGIRNGAVGITGTVYRPLNNTFQIKEVMDKLIELLNSTESVLDKSLIANSMVSYIQPFSDGNKRTGRMLTNAILLAYDYFPLSYRSIDEDEFKKALILFYEQGSIFHLKRLFIEQLVFANDTYFK